MMVVVTDIYIFFAWIFIARAASVTLPSPSSSFGGDLPSSPEKNFSQTPMEPYNSPPSSEKTLYTTPHYNHYEEFDFGPMVMSPTSNTKELVRYHHQLNACLNGGHPSVPTMGGAEGSLLFLFLNCVHKTCKLIRLAIFQCIGCPMHAPLI